MLGKIAQGSNTSAWCGHARPISSCARRAPQTMPPLHHKILLRASACFLLLALSLALLTILTPRANAQGTTSVQYLFGGAPGGPENFGMLQTYTVDPTTGALTLIAPTPPLFRSAVGTGVVNPAGTFLFLDGVNSAGTSVVSVFTIAANGATAELPASPFAGSSAGNALGIAISPDGKFLYVLTSILVGTASAVVDVFSIGTDGTAMLVNSYPLPLFVTGAFLHPTGLYLYVYGEVFDTPRNSVIEQFDVGPSGTLIDEGPAPLEEFSIEPYSITGNAAGTFLFAWHGQLGSHESFIDTLSVDPVDGTISTLAIFDAGPFEGSVGSGLNLGTDPTGSFLYSPAGASYSISNGILTQLQPNDNTSPSGPPAQIVSPTSPFLFQSGENVDSQFLISDQIQTDGSLTPAPGSPYPFASILAVTGNVPVPTQPVLTVPPGPQNFGQVVVGKNALFGLGISSTGFGNVNITSISVTGDSSFTETNNCPATLTPSMGCVITVTFAPTSVASVTGSVVITSNVPQATFDLSGAGIAPFPIGGVTPNSIVFPDTAVGAKSVAQAFTVSNGTQATASLVVQSVSISGSNPNDFSETNNCAAPIPAGGSCSVSVTFSPLATGNRAAALVIPTNDTEGGALGGGVSGNGTAATSFTLQTSAVGPGTIQQTPAGTSFAANTSITLTAVPSANATFTSWAGACAGSTNAVCTFALAANTSVTATFTANPAVTVPQTPPPAPAGSPITAQITVTGFAMPPTLKASCTIPQGSCSISGTTLTVTTTARSSGLVPGKFPRVPNLPAVPREILLIALAGGGLALLAKNSRAKQFLRPAALTAALLFAGCGGGSNTPPPATGTPAGNYTITITATLGAQTATTSVTVTVQ